MKNRTIEEIEKECRDIWTVKGVPKEKQDAILADAESKARPGAKVGPFTIPMEAARL